MLARENVGQTLLVILALSAGCSVGASETAYIRLQKSDYYKSTTNQSSFTNMLDKSYGWADPVNGNGAAPRSDADYLVDEGKVLCTPYDNKSSTVWAFGGRSLVIDGSKLYVRTAKTASLEFDDLVFRGASESIVTTKAKPLTLTGGLNGQGYQIDSALHGNADAWISCKVASTTAAGDGRFTRVWLLGDNSDYAGTVWVDYQTTLALGSSMPGTVALGSTNETQAATLTTLAAADEVISVATLSSDVLGVVDVPPTNELRVVNGLSVAKVLNKTGLGTLAIGGSASAESGASFTVGEGALKPLSATAIGSLPVTFAAGTSVKLDWEPSDAAVAERGLDLSCSPFVVSGDALTFAFDYGDVKLEKKTFKKALVTVKDADAEKLAGKINVARVRGFNAQLLPPVSVGGETTCSVEFVPSGIVVIVK